MTRRMLLTPALALLALCAALPADAGEKTVSVVAVGEVEVRPDTLVVSGTITENSEKIKDAVTAFVDTRRRALASVNALGIDGLQVTTSALSMSMAGDMAEFNEFGGPAAAPVPAGSLTISQDVTLTVTGLDQMEEQRVIDLVVELIEAAGEAGIDLTASSQEAMMAMRFGMGMPESASATFKISDPDAAQRSATRAAVEKARADAAFLAELAGGELGPVVAIGDAPAGEDDAQMNPYAMWFGMMNGETDGFASNALEPITVVRGLRVTFELISE